MNIFAEPSASRQGRGVERRFEPLTETNRGYAVSAFLAIGIHASVLFGWPKDGLFEPAEYGVARGESAMEVALIAAPPISEDEPAESHEPFESPEPIDQVEEESAPEQVPAPLAPPPESVQEMPKPEQIREAKTQPTPSSASAMPRPKEKTAPPPRKDARSAGKNSASSGAQSSSVNAISGSLTIKPTYLHNPHPLYPELSRKAGHTGVVILRVSVSESGRVAAVRLIKSSGYSPLDDRARTTVQRWIFRPARQNGKPRATQVDVPVRFSLDR
jgi:periplasmic protein TonB